MTKNVRIENADMSSFKVRVTAQRKDEKGEWVDDNEKPRELAFPTALTEVIMHSGKRYIIEEF